MRASVTGRSRFERQSRYASHTPLASEVPRSRLNSLRLATKVGLAFGLLACFLLATGATAFYAKRQLTGVIDRLTGPAWTAADGAMEAQILIEHEIILTLQALEPDPVRGKNLQELALAKHQSELGLARLLASKLIPRADLERLSANRTALQESRDRLLNAVTDPMVSAELLGGYRQGLNSAVLEILRTLTFIEAIGDAQVEGQQMKTTALLAKINAALISVVTLGILACVLLAVFIIHKVADPVAAIAQHLAQIASAEGNLDVRLEVKSGDEVGVLANGFNVFIGKLRLALGTISHLSGDVENASRHLSTVTSAVSSSIDKQQMETDQIASAFNELAASAQSIADTTLVANAASERSQARAEEGRLVMGKVTHAISVLAHNVQNATGAILDLERNSSDIGRVLEVIRAVAEQTNLLALNAAIEAARAGDQGRGFAVVADEVRTLAKRTGESTEEIHQMIEALQNTIRRVSSAMEQSRQKAVATADTALKAEGALSAIGSAVAESRRLNAEIAGASDEQRNVTGAIQRTVMKIHNHMIETCCAAEASFRTADDLRNLAQRMNETLTHFKAT